MTNMWGKKILKVDLIKEGTSESTVPTPPDFPPEYEYGSGKMQDWDNIIVHRKLPLPENNDTVLNAKVNPDDFQAFYLWEKDNMPTSTSISSNMVNYFDSPDFRPFITALPKPKNSKPKGAVIILAGGGFQVRSNYTDALAAAAALRENGFQTFVLDYRIAPYSSKEGALDIARAIRFVRNHADDYQIRKNDIGLLGFASGAVQNGEFLLNYKNKNGTVIDSNYTPDELDKVSDDVSSNGMIYGFFGQLKIGDVDGQTLRQAKLPPTFYVYGTDDPFYRQFDYQFQVMRTIGNQVSRVVLNDWSHGFGADGGWLGEFSEWLESSFRPYWLNGFQI